MEGRSMSAFVLLLAKFPGGALRMRRGTLNWALASPAWAWRNRDVWATMEQRDECWLALCRTSVGEDHARPALRTNGLVLQATVPSC